MRTFSPNASYRPFFDFCLVETSEIVKEAQKGLADLVVTLWALAQPTRYGKMFDFPHNSQYYSDSSNSKYPELKVLGVNGTGSELMAEQLFNEEVSDRSSRPIDSAEDTNPLAPVDSIDEMLLREEGLFQKEQLEKSLDFGS